MLRNRTGSCAEGRLASIESFLHYSAFGPNVNSRGVDGPTNIFGWQRHLKPCEWHDARRLSVQVYSLVRSRQFGRDHGLADQLRRSAVSVMSNIAEGFERGRRAEFARFLVIAKGSLAELRSQLYVAEDAAYTTVDQATKLRQHAVVLSRQLDALIAGVKIETGNTVATLCESFFRPSFH